MLSAPLNIEALNASVPSNTAGPTGDVVTVCVWLAVAVTVVVCVCDGLVVDEAVAVCDAVCELDCGCDELDDWVGL